MCGFGICDLLKNKAARGESTNPVGNVCLYSELKGRGKVDVVFL